LSDNSVKESKFIPVVIVYSAKGKTHKKSPPEEFFRYLDAEIAQESAPTETRMKGYRVKVEYDPSSVDDMEKKKSAIGETIINAKKGKKNL